ncbi:unnamed protein product [Chondrus crispus]|uniref:Metallo-beta-lactamase domain-containing protein n=1 Tax=Chondrus crispus TaxID=2769 RepID=R7QKP9_CHOCR|nr:unnamed protein product [Chondrus crispus]CDF38654.1 unnamed protein product [Chondrus crispus]|eukprot:XP_005718559.1 unnamed protein product [Chondrus crispus]
MPVAAFAGPVHVSHHPGTPSLRAVCRRPPRFSASAPVRRPENAPGDLYVDSSCIDCDTCKWLAPQIFHSSHGQSAVYNQPTTPDAQLIALQAAVACPTGSIRTTKPSRIARDARSSFPLAMPNTLESTTVPDVFYNGFASPDTFGGASWLVIQRGDDPCVIMFDCPRFFKPLSKAIKKMAEPLGGIRYLVLSHQDDVAGHAKWASELGAERVIHKRECNERQGTTACEVQLEDANFPYTLMEGVELIHVPGHTSGSIAMLHRGTQSLFTGDHIFYSQREDRLCGARYIMHSREELVKSVEKLVNIPFLHGWPGHGGHFHFSDEEDRITQITSAVKFMRDSWKPW